MQAVVGDGRKGDAAVSLKSFAPICFDLKSLGTSYFNQMQNFFQLAYELEKSLQNVEVSDPFVYLNFV